MFQHCKISYEYWTWQLPASVFNDSPTDRSELSPQ